MSKTTKKNNVAIEWPSNTHFTIDDLTKKYPGFVNITLRFRVKRGIENKEIVTIGKVKPPIGRPRLVFAKANPSKELIAAAFATGMLELQEKPKKLPVTKTETISVGEVKTDKKIAKKAVVVPVIAPVAVDTSTQPATAPTTASTTA
jgi:hypothetical protein